LKGFPSGFCGLEAAADEFEKLEEKLPCGQVNLEIVERLEYGR